MRHFRTTIFILFCLTLVPGYGQNIDSLVKARVDFGETPAMVVGVYANGKTTYYAQGFANIEKREKATPKTLFEIGSITKTFTNIILERMIEKGQLSLEDPIQKYLAAPIKVPEINGKAITIENLATARSGLPRMPNNFSPADPENPYIDYNSTKLADFLSHYELTRDPGSKYEYSNLGMGLLGYTLTIISHKTYSKLLEEFITGPLKMSQTFLNTPERNGQPHAQGYTGNTPVKAWTWSDESVMAPAGGILSNAEDMMKYIIANLSTTTPLSKSMDVTHKPRHDAGGATMEIGMAWHILNHKIIWHNGGTGGFRSFAGFDPATQMGVVILTNSIAGADDLGFYLLDHTLPLKTIHKSTAIDPKILNDYVGVYEMAPTFSITISIENGSLFLQATGQGRFELFGESEKKFFLKVVDAQIEFVRNDKGEVEKLLLYQGGAIQPARKVK